MKKATLLLVLAMLLGTMTPALAEKPEDKEKQKNVAPLTQTQIQSKFVRRQASIQGELVSMSGTTLPATIVVNVSKVAPKKNKKWIGAYPEVKKEITVKVDANTKFVRKYWGKSSLEELTVGDKLDVRVKTNEDGSVTATLVKDDTLHWTWKVHNGAIDGLDLTAKTFTLKQKNGKSVTVKVDAKTKIFIPNASATSTFDGLQNGQIAHVRGIINNKTKVITASLIRVSAPRVVAPVVTATSTATTIQ